MVEDSLAYSNRLKLLELVMEYGGDKDKKIARSLILSEFDQEFGQMK
jgi:hypothetical protein